MGDAVELRHRIGRVIDVYVLAVHVFTRVADTGEGREGIVQARAAARDWVGQEHAVIHLCLWEGDERSVIRVGEAGAVAHEHVPARQKRLGRPAHRYRVGEVGWHGGAGDGAGIVE